MPLPTIEIRLDIHAASLIKTLVAWRLIQLDEADATGTSPGGNIRASYERALEALDRALPPEMETVL